MAARNDSEIARAFAAGEAPNEKLFNKVRDNNGGWGGGNTPMHASTGTRRFWYKQEGKVLLFYSYLMGLAVRVTVNGKPFIVLNGDAAPSNKTSAHQQMLLHAVKRSGVPWCLIPFTALNAAGIRHPEDIEIIATTPDKVVTVKTICRRADCKHLQWDRDTPDNADGSHTVVSSRHFLGETLFRHIGAYYVAGLDRNDDPIKRIFYLARVPHSMLPHPKTVDAALDLLRPKGLPKNTPRQGEWFLVPTPKLKVSDKDPALFKQSGHSKQWPVSRGRSRASSRVPSPIEGGIKNGIPVISATPSIQQSAINASMNPNINFSSPLNPRYNRHRATNMYINGDVYVRGRMRDAEHGTYTIGDGKTWHKVVKNRAEGSWQATGSVD